MTSLYSVTEAAQWLAISPQAVRQAIASRRLAAKKIGKQWVIDCDDLDDFATARLR